MTADKDLSRVVMPVVLVMNLPDLTWGQREACAEAIQASLKQYGELMAEPDETKPVKRVR